ncbi:MAG: sugar ABC transporter substrate-binding protein [Candidatus Moduliflexus flocculans]|nr:sugar ABC transporter substrate-binding protein [Candidatus Moduliflexus flocculans]
MIRAGTGDGGDGLTPHQQIIQNFEDQNPNVIVQLEPVSGRDYYARLLTQLAAKAAPDIMQIGDDAVPSFVTKNAFVPLDTYLKDSNFDASIYLPGLLDPGKVDGKQYLLPKDYSPLAVYYNKKLFDAASVPYPVEGWTWEDLLATAQKLTLKDASGNVTQWGIQLPAAWTTGFEYWVAAAGGSLISQDGKSFAGAMDSPEVARAVQFYADLYNKYQVAPQPADMNAFGGGNSEFANGKAAMMLFGRWPQAGFKTNPNISLGVVAPPKDKVRANILFWGGFGIATSSQEADTAFKYLSYVSGEPGAQVWKDWALPAVKSVADSSGLSKDPIEGVWIGELNYLAPRAYTFTPYWNETADPALRKVLESVILDPNADVKGLLAQAAKDAQAALDKLGK